MKTKHSLEKAFVSPVKTCRSNGVSKHEEIEVDNEFPMKRFKGTKWRNGKTFEAEKIVKTHGKLKSVGVLDFSDEKHLQTLKHSEYDCSNFMSKLEQFSDVWNDCPEHTEARQTESRKFESSYDTPDLNKKTWNEQQLNHNRSNKTSHDDSSWHREKQFESFKKVEPQKQHESFKNQHLTEKPKTQHITDVDHQPESQQESKSSDAKLADLKRKKAVEEHRQLHDGQKNIIKQALKSLDGKSRPNTKIIFSDAEENDLEKVGFKERKAKKKKLFDEDGDDNNITQASELETGLTLNPQFQGKKGQKLLELQSKFASDSRFKLDTRFYESGSEVSENEASENIDHEDEKKRQLSILESVLKRPIKPLSETKKKKMSSSQDTLVLRFDPTREDHQKYVLEPQKPKVKDEKEEDSSKQNKNSKKKKVQVKTPTEERKNQATNEKFFTVKEDFKETLKKDSESKFSLLQMFGSKEPEESKSSSNQDSAGSIHKVKHKTRNPFKYDSSESEPEESDKKESKKEENKDPSACQPTAKWTTNLFFSENDSRIQEALEFLKREEKPEDNKEFAEKRKELKDFIKHKFKNFNRKQTLFKKKLGGLKKKSVQKGRGKAS